MQKLSPTIEFPPKRKKSIDGVKGKCLGKEELFSHAGVRKGESQENPERRVKKNNRGSENREDGGTGIGTIARAQKKAGTKNKRGNKNLIW